MQVLHSQNSNLLEFLDDHIDSGQGSHKVAMKKKNSSNIYMPSCSGVL